MRAIIMTLCAVCTASAGLTAGATSEPQSYLGYRAGAFMPYLSVGFLNTSGEFSQYSYEYNEVIGRDEEKGDTIRWNLGMISPTLGLKVFAGKKPIRPFLRTSAGMPLPVYLQVTSTDSVTNEDIEMLKDKMYENPELKVSLTGGAGLEYDLSASIGISAEINYTYMFGGALVSYSYTQETDDEGSVYYEQEKISHAGFNLGRTGAALGLNFYF